ncbi:hypothetical protein [Vibrio sinaloensis]|uniref:hypothetical protein n=1 Tax=Photobacterium sp. (strain ATCC 43367) TaxID=379097 RepID=UPI00205BBEFE|nr:hypothetical protein [Vibrio sinaloensis]UPQ89554.1 hypothetical protein MTO69_17530 [Vibrio sinaloensis]
MINPVYRGRLIFIALVLLFALPAVIAKTVLSQHWYQSGVTNKGVLIEPTLTLSALDIDSPLLHKQWQLAYVVPEQCDAFCQQQIYLLGQSHIALGKYQQRVQPVLITTPSSAKSSPSWDAFSKLQVAPSFTEHVGQFEFVIVDPLGQLVMRYPKAESEEQLTAQSKGLLADLRKLLKLSRVG